jgi:hypothetical protein
MRELLGGKGTISLLDCSAENAPNTDLYLYLLLKFQMVTILSFPASYGSEKRKFKYTCLSEARASQSHKTWAEVYSSALHLLHKGLYRSAPLSKDVFSRCYVQ